MTPAVDDLSRAGEDSEMKYNPTIFVGHLKSPRKSDVSTWLPSEDIFEYESYKRSLPGLVRSPKGRYIRKHTRSAASKVYHALPVTVELQPAHGNINTH